MTTQFEHPIRIEEDHTQARMVVEGVPDRPGTAAAVFCALADADVAVGLIVETVDAQGLATLTFTVPEHQRHKAFGQLQQVLDALGSGKLIVQGPVATITVGGRTVAETRAAGARLFRALAAAEINIHMINTSGSGVSVVVNVDDGPKGAAIAQEAFARP